MEAHAVSQRAEAQLRGSRLSPLSDTQLQSRAEAARRHYDRNRPAMLDKFAARRRDFADFLNAAKDVPCADCGSRFPVECMDFDHVRGEKVANISRMHGHSREALLAELAKCEVVCSNCHRIRTTKRLKGTQ